MWSDGAARLLLPMNAVPSGFRFPELVSRKSAYFPSSRANFR